MKKITCIYKITCLSNCKIYIGSAVDFCHRKRGHLQFLRLKKHKNSHLQYTFNLYGEEAFVFEIIELVEDRNNLIEREQYWLDTTGCYNRTVGFNICLKADSSIGVKRTDEFKEKIRLHNLSRPQEVKDKTKAAVLKANIGRIPWNKGTKMWETRSHPKGGLGKKYPKRKLSAEQYKNICEINRRPKTEEYLAKRSTISSKNYYLIAPNSGCELKINNLKLFCLENGLNHTRMYEVAKGKIQHHRGWMRDEDCYVIPDAA